MLLARSLSLPRNSGVQTILPLLYDAMLDAENMDPRFRHFAIDKIKNRELGIASLSSEGADMLKLLQTTRQISHLETRNIGPPAGIWDRKMYGDKVFKNNPQGKDDGFI